MRAQSTALLCVLLCLGACGSKAPEFTDPIAALEAAESARAAKDEEGATRAYDYAIANAGSKAELKYKALLGLGELQAARAGRTRNQPDVEAAMATFARVESECASAYDIRGAQRIIDAWIMKARNLNRAENALKAAEARFPNDTDKLDKQRKGVKFLETGDTAGLKSIGYVGD